MNTKEAIKILRRIENTYLKENVGRPCIDEVMSFRHIIKLLQQGERFEAMWGELEVYVEGVSPALSNKMNILWQKYIIKKGGK